MINTRAAIFDMDGTLLDSEFGWENVAEEFLKSRGKTPKPGLQFALRPLGGHEIPRYFKTEYGIDEPERQIADAINSYLESFYFNTAALKAGAIPVLTELKRRGVKMCIATATDRYLVEAALKRCGVLNFFLRVYTCGEEGVGKSVPDIYLRAAEFLGAPISETFVYEDALYAIKSAKKAGFPVVGMYDSAADDQQNEIRGLVDYYLKSFEDWEL